jgi:hypothetical protein
VWSRIRGDRVVAELKDGDLAALNSFLAARGIFASHLALEQRTLEDVFMEVTGADGGPEAGTGPGADAGPAADEQGGHRLGEIP